MLPVKYQSVFKTDPFKKSVHRVSIKSFPDYKHLSQENYCMWNTNFFFHVSVYVQGEHKVFP